jgi:hypothetical protein
MWTRLPHQLQVPKTGWTVACKLLTKMQRTRDAREVTDTKFDPFLACRLLDEGTCPVKHSNDLRCQSRFTQHSENDSYR